MLIDPVDTAAAVKIAPAEQPGRSLLVPAVAVVAAVSAYSALTAWVLSSSTAKVYGFPISHDLRTLIEIALQVCPMLAAFFFVLLSPVKHRFVECRYGTVVASLGMAAVFVCATAATIAGISGFAASGPRAVTLFWVAGELLFDLTLIGIFTTLLYAIKRRVWIAILLFVAYIVVVLAAGPQWGITSYIGFGSTVPVMLTTYSTAPLYDGAAWLLRAYWTAITILLLAVRYTLAHRGKRPLIAVLAWGAVCASIGASLFHLQGEANAKYAAVSQAAIDAALQGGAQTGRLRLMDFDLRLNFTPEDGTVAVAGGLTLQSQGGSVHTAYFQAPGLMPSARLEIRGAGDYRTTALGKYVQVKFSDPVDPHQTIQIAYSGSIQPANAFDLAVSGKVLPNAFFLSGDDLLFSSRSAACLAANAKEACGATENYLLGDVATGRISVIAPGELMAAGPGDESATRLFDGRVEHQFTIPAPRLSTFLLACGPFQQSEAISSNSVKVRVLRSPATRDTGASETALAESILSFYESHWSAYSRPSLSIVEVPTPLGEAMAFDGMVALSDKIIASRSPMSGKPSGLLEFVMAHEIAHQWWGYRMTPSRAAGRLFLLESFPQYAAYKFLNDRGILSVQEARKNEERRYQSARGRLRNQDVPLAQADAVNEVAYNKGPMTLLTLDGLAGPSFMTNVTGLLTSHTYDTHGNTQPDEFLAALIAGLPQNVQETARGLIFGSAAPRP